MDEIPKEEIYEGNTVSINGSCRSEGEPYPASDFSYGMRIYCAMR